MLKKCGSFLLLLFSSLSAYADDPIVLASDPYPPYIMDTADGNGFVTDIAIKALAAKGLKAVYKNVPFKRAIKGVEAGEYDGVLAISKDARENFIYPSETLGAFRNSFFTRKDDNWQWKGSTKDLEDRTLGFITGYEFGSETGFMDYIKANEGKSKRLQIVSGSDALEKNMKKLESSRIDVFIDDELVVWYTANKVGLTDAIRSAGSFQQDKPEYVSIGFKKGDAKAEAYVKALDEGIQILRESGELQKILEKYGLKSLE